MLPKEECEILLNSILPMAETQLEKNKEFFPFGAILKVDDTVAMTSVFDGNESPDPAKVIRDLIVSHQESAQQGEIKASGIVWNGSVISEGKTADAIIASLEHKTGYSVVVGRTYKVGMFRKIKLGDLFAHPGKHDVFGSL